MKRSKKGSKSRNNPDRISELPEVLIEKILCLLPTEVAASTSVLSKQWQSYWKVMPKLKFDGLNRGLELGNLCKSLLSHKAPVLQRLHLKVRLDGRDNVLDFGILIGIALTRNVRELVLEVYSHRRAFRFPRSLYNCETLETLELMLNAVMDVPSSVSLRSLRTLNLLCVDFKDEESIVNFLSGCSNLQDLVLRGYIRSRMKICKIVVPSLQRLTIHNGHCDPKHWHYMINTPSLKYLKIKGSMAFESSLIVNVPELVEVNITDVSEITEEKLLIVLTSVKRLSLAISPLNFKFPIGSIFDQLVCLELGTNKKAWWDLLSFMLHSSPKLQVLKFIDDIGWVDSVEATGVWNPPENVPKCLLSHLETFMWKGYKRKRKEELEVAKYILKNTNRLKRASFSLNLICSYRDRLEVLNDLKSVVRDRNSCQVQFII